MNLTADEELTIATAALGAVEEIIKAFLDAKSGKVSASDVLTQLAVLTDSIAAQRAVADNAASAKFDTSEKP